MVTNASKMKEEEMEVGKNNSLKRKGKLERKAKVKKEKSNEIKDIWEPNNWIQLLENIKVMRQDENAPVDSQGCERTADEKESPEARCNFCLSL